MVKRPQVNRRNVRKLSPGFIAAGSSPIAAVTLVAGKMRCIFDRAIVLSGVPRYTNQGNLAISATVVSALTIDVGFTVNPVATNVWIIPANDVAIRSAQGGAVAAATGVFS